MNVPPPERASRLETTLAVLFCLLAVFGPLIYIQYRYEEFTEEYGFIREGAAGATVALAAIIRAVSRTVLRTVIRTSARASIKVFLRGAFKALFRVAGRALFAGLIRQTKVGSHLAGRDNLLAHRGNTSRLFFASVLLYLSWVVVIGIGQPFEKLSSDDDPTTMRRTLPEISSPSAIRTQPGEKAYELQQQLFVARETVRQIDGLIATETEPVRRADLIAERQTAVQQLTVLTTDFLARFVEAGGRVISPAIEKPLEPNTIDKTLESLFTPSAFHGVISWRSPVIWLGGLVFVVPLWLIHAVMTLVARLNQATITCETGWDGALIQLYFAGAFSFMPLAADVRIEGTKAARGKVALVGLLVPSLLALACWLAWNWTGRTSWQWLMAGDAFLIYPLVQVFPIRPLFGVEVWQWNRSAWTAVFFAILIGFVMIGSEGLKNVL